MKIPKHYFIDYPQQYNSTVRVNSKIIYKDTSIKPEQNLIQYGTVISSPNDQVKEGDKIYFSYLVADGGYEMVKHEGKQYLRVPEDVTYCKVSDGVITPLAEHVLCRAVYDEEVEEVDVDGKKIKAKMAGNLVIQLHFTYDKRVTEIAHIGENEHGLKGGDTVIMDTYCDNTNTIEGIEYFVMKQENILCTMSES